MCLVNTKSFVFSLKGSTDLFYTLMQVHWKISSPGDKQPFETYKKVPNIIRETVPNIEYKTFFIFWNLFHIPLDQSNESRLRDIFLYETTERRVICSKKVTIKTIFVALCCMLSLLLLLKDSKIDYFSLVTNIAFILYPLKRPVPIRFFFF